MAAEQSVCFVKCREHLPTSAGVWVKLRDELAALQTLVRADSTVIIAGRRKDMTEDQADHPFYFPNSIGLLFSAQSPRAPPVCKPPPPAMGLSALQGWLRSTVQ